MERALAQAIVEAALSVAFNPGDRGAKTFNDIFGKGKWEKMDAKDLVKNPALADEFYQLMSEAYKDIGGHINLKNPKSFFNGKLKFIAIDMDNDPYADALKVFKLKSAGLKSVGMGHDGSSPAKKAVVKKTAELLKHAGHYGELSGAIAHIMLTRYGIPSVNDEDIVRKVLKKDIEWVGPHPSGKYPDNPGWYNRKIAGKSHMKILVGLPAGAR